MVSVRPLYLLTVSNLYNLIYIHNYIVGLYSTCGNKISNEIVHCVKRDFLLQTCLPNNFTVWPWHYMIISGWTFLSHLIYDFINFYHAPLQSSVFTQKTPCSIRISNRIIIWFLNTSGILCTFIISLYAFWDRIVRTSHNIQDAAKTYISSIIILTVSHGIPFLIF